MEVSEKARQLHFQTLVIDTHVHPSLKTYLFKKKLWKAHRSGGAFNPFTMRVDLPKTIAGGVDALVEAVEFDVSAVEDRGTQVGVFDRNNDDFVVG